MSERAQITGNRLIIRKIQSEDFGEYTCTVITLKNQTVKSTFTLTDTNESMFTTVHPRLELTSDQRPKVKINPIELDIREGGKIQLECISGNFNTLFRKK